VSTALSGLPKIDAGNAQVVEVTGIARSHLGIMHNSNGGDLTISPINDSTFRLTLCSQARIMSYGIRIKRENARR
jgi:hypothetical protein